jgi:hypothetical protein
MDWYIRGLTFQAQLSPQPKSPDGEAALYNPTSMITESGDWSAWGKKESAKYQASRGGK